VTANTDDLAERRASWSAYWATGALHSCVGSFEGNYSGDVATFWTGFVAGLGDEARVLDVATGNGALPALFLQVAPEGVRLQVDAVDLAQLRPAWLDGAPEGVRERVRFHPGVAAEALPFADDGFDAVASQFGLEYTDTARAVAELRRVARPGARVGLVLHHARSLIVDRAREELRHLAWLLDEARLPEAGAALCTAFAQASTPEGARRLAGDAEANALRARYNALMVEADRRVAASSCPDVIDEARQAISQGLMASRAGGRAEAGREAIAALAARLRESRLRLRELVDCALDEAGVHALLAPAGVTLDRLEELRFDSGDVMAWGVLARLPR
jgi:SAM-dependent methyltransferase